MKKNFFLILCALLATSVLAQQTPTSPAPAATPPAPEPAKTSTPTPENKKTEKAAVKPAKAAKKSAPPAFVEKHVVLVPGPATVDASNVNVRGKATFAGEVITRVNKGDAVTVVEQVILDKPKAGEPSQWAKIVLPTGVNVWVHNTYVDKANGTVIPKRLNVRAGAGENYSIVGLIEKGAVVKQVSTKGDWIEIEAPANAFGFVAATYLKQEGTAPEVPPVFSVATAEPTTPPTPATVTEPGGIAPPPTETPEVATTTTPGTPVEEPMPTPAPDTTSEPPPAEEPLPPRIVSHEGVVRATVSIQAPTPFEIWDPSTRMTVNYLYTTSTNLNLGLYRGRRIIVTGEEGLDRRWKTPVITIQRIQVIEN